MLTIQILNYLKFFGKATLSFLILINLFSNCDKPTNKFEKKDQIVHYLKNVKGIHSYNNSILFFITGVSTGCQPCEKELLELLETMINSMELAKYEKYVVLNDTQTILVNDYILSGKCKVLSDTQYNLQRHGIDLPYNFLVELDSKLNVVYWNWLTKDYFNELYKNYLGKD